MVHLCNLIRAMKNAEAYAKQQSVHFELHEKIPTIEIW